MEIPIFIVDAFTNVPFKGNPAAVCLLENELQDDLYQSIAAEMNFSATAFITRRDSMDFSSGARFGLRWFTPTCEASICGHGTQASAAVLFYLKKNVNPVLEFETMSGELYVRRDEESLIMDFPLNTPKPQDQHEIKDLLKAAVGNVPIQDVCFNPKTSNLLIRLADTCDRSALTSLKPEAEALLKNESTGKIKGVIVTMKGAPTAQPGYDIYSRYFAPWLGVLEDPVCGSAHTVLAAYWSEKLSKKKLLGARFGLRWFTPKNEVPLCGHATLASAAVLFYLKKNVNPVLVFETISGELYVRQDEESLIMDFPLNTPNPQDQHEIKDLLKAVVGDIPIQDVCYSPTTRKLLIRLADTCDRSELTSLKPEAEALLKNESTGKIKGVIVTMKGAPTAQPGYDFYSRYFAPWVGIHEDPVCGNPAAICLIENELQDDLYQSIAAEMNLSETAFIIKRDSVDFSSGARFGLRWFTPKCEFPLCGHATLASAAVLFYLKKNVNPVIVFETMSGELYVRQHEESLIMDFPLNTPNPQDQHEFKDLLKAAVGDLPIHEVCYNPTIKYLMVRLADTCDRSQLVSLKPEAETLLSNETTGMINSLIITLKGAESTQSGYDFYSRVFGPWVGVPEDPVTAYQCSRRGGEVKMELRNDGRVDIIGQAHIVLQGTLKI
ncbi:phenazine biosynthesis-like domain-containing [Labeo rohita]|uniref:Phenazine biosynthesis-like domain-containing n=1 Tax=Labeo rohita TaxID=84645 RepID=A0A498N6F0_LABRO|nr:phenazine biosynthesis-like domain-containing [Labeo rohita]